jgi:hypothetical protein
MRGLSAYAAAFCGLALLCACTSSGDTGSAGGWRVSGGHIRISGDATACRTPAPAVDTFSATPTPQAGCSPQPALANGASPTPSSSASPQTWGAVHTVHTEDYSSATAQTQWKPIYTTYTAPPGTGIYQPMVHATNQPMPTPYASASPTPTVTSTPIPTARPVETPTPGLVVQPSATPWP